MQRCGLLESLRRLNLTFWWGVLKAHLLLKKILLKTFLLLFRDLTVAAVLVGIILLFIVCHSFKFVVNAYEAHLTYSSKCNCCCFQIANPLDFSIQLTFVAAILNCFVNNFYLLCKCAYPFPLPLNKCINVNYRGSTQFGPYYYLLAVTQI